MSIESSNSVGQMRAISAIDTRMVRHTAGDRSQAAGKPSQVSPVQTSEALDPGPVPIDAERVTAIRKAIETGTYPLVPAKVADAIIAAGLLLRNLK